MSFAAQLIFLFYKLLLVFGQLSKDVMSDNTYRILKLCDYYTSTQMHKHDGVVIINWEGAPWSGQLLLL